MSFDRLLRRIQGLPSISVSRAFEEPEDDLRRTGDRWAAVWREAGLRSGDRLAVVVSNGPDFVSALVACLQLGLTFVPLNPSLNPHEREARGQQISAAALLDANGLRRIGAERAIMPGPTPSVILFTSGSAGEAKPVALSESALLHVVDSHQQILGLVEGVRIHSYLPWSHAFGFTLELLLGLLHGARIRCFSPQALPEAIATAPSDFLLTVPRMLQRIDATPLRKLTGGIVGGAPVRGELRRKLQGTKLRVGYGQTECAPGATLGAPGQWSHDDFLGSPVGCEVRLGDLDELQLRGPNLAMGYVNGPQVEPLALEDGWRSTGDLAVRTDDGFLFAGRRDELFKLDNGRMINPVPLELPFDGAILLVFGAEGVQPLARGRLPARFSLPVPHAAPRLMPESFWRACTTPTGKISRLKARQLAQLSEEDR